MGSLVSNTSEFWFTSLFSLATLTGILWAELNLDFLYR